MSKRTLAILMASVLVALGCGERAAPTEPQPQATSTRPPNTATPVPGKASATATPGASTTATATPVATATPTPKPASSPTPAGDALSVKVTLYPMDPPAGFKHAVRANMVVTETQGRTATLTGITTFSFATYDGVQIDVSGFTPRQLDPHASTSYSLTVTATEDIPCADGFVIEVYFNNGTSKHLQPGTYFDCTTGEWLF